MKKPGHQTGGLEQTPAFLCGSNNLRSIYMNSFRKKYLCAVFMAAFFMFFLTNSFAENKNNTQLIQSLKARGITEANAEINKPRTFLVPLEQYRKMRDSLKDPRQEWEKIACQALLESAEHAVTTGPWSVMDKPDALIGPSKDKHDFVSFSMYHWQEKDGTWSWRDGKKNPAMKSSDEDGLYALYSSARNLTWAGYFLGKREYMERAALLLRYWFINKETAMNPNLNFAGAIPGKASGRGVGIHRMSKLPEILDCIGLLQDAGCWTENDQRGMLKWVAEYLKWAASSELGKEERAQPNNHSVYYGFQMLACALYCGNAEAAAFYLNDYFMNMLKHIEPDGSAPAELKRTRPESYVFYNMDGFINYAELARTVGIDLYNVKDERGVSLEKSFEWLIPIFKGEKTFPRPKVKDRPVEVYHAFKTCRLGTLRLKNPVYEQYLRTRFPKEWEKDVQNLFWPPEYSEKALK